MQRLDGPRWITFLYNQNPFYLISSCLILFGLQNAFEDQNGPVLDPRVLAGLLGGYTAALAITSVLIVRIGRVWDDARSIFMVLLLLFFALSASFDSFCISSPLLAATVLSCGFLFVVATTELILWQLEIKFPRHFRLPYYAMLACSFVFPIVISISRFELPGVDVRWLLLAFPFLCAGSILTLLPAIWLTAKHVSKNGTPWEWPWYPYSVFTLLVVGLCGRVVLLTMAFDPSSGSGSIFGFYFLVPILFAVLVVLYEIGRIEKIEALRCTTLVGSLLLLAASANFGFEGSQREFWSLITNSFASPAWCTMLGLIGFSAWAARYDKEVAGFLFFVLLIGASVFQPNGMLVSQFFEIAIWPVLALAVQTILVNKRRPSYGWFVASIWLSVAVASITQRFGFDDYALLIAFHFVVLSGLVIGFRFDDSLARQLRICTAFVFGLLMLGLAITALVGPTAIANNQFLISLYVAAIEIITAITFLLTRNRIFRAVTWLGAGAVPLSILAQIPHQFDPRYEKLAWFGSIGIGCFLLGAFVSSLKAGLAGSFYTELKACFGDSGEAVGESG